MKKAVVILSGGLDSTLCAYMTRDMGYEIVALHFNYAQKTETKELEAFSAICDDLGVSSRYVIDLDFLANITTNALIDPLLEVRRDGVSEELPSTYVAFRNGIFLSIAGSLCEKEQASLISIGVVEEDSSGYPDCRESFIQSMQKSLNLGTKDSTSLEIFAPLLHLSKGEIVKKSFDLGVPLHLTWSCYSDGNKACGECDSCRLRLKGFADANKTDPIIYRS